MPVIGIIATISGKEREQLIVTQNLRSLGITSSVEILKIQSALERKFGQKLPPLGDSWTIDRIEAQVGLGGRGAESQGSRETSDTRFPPILSTHSPIPNPQSSSLFIGVDIEEVDHLPVTSNYRTHDFYQSLFSKEEISSALLKPDPRMHLCGIFCAKEALKKSAPELINLRMDEIQTQHRQGRPFISTTHDSINARFTFQVSISHSHHYAVATVLALA